MRWTSPASSGCFPRVTGRRPTARPIFRNLSDWLSAGSARRSRSRERRIRRGLRRAAPELGAGEVNRRLLRAAGLSHLVIDTGHRASIILDVPEMASVAGVPAHEIVRIEALAEEVARSGVDAVGFAAAFADRLRVRSRDAVGLKTIVAYRTTFAIDYARPSAAEVAAAAGQWMRSAEAAGRWRLADPVIIRELLWAAAETCRERRFPLQVHVGVGDADILMHACDPTHFTPFIARWTNGTCR